ncbi:MAG: polyprenyl synthetase family protein [Pirellulales bacterium]
MSVSVSTELSIDQSPCQLIDSALDHYSHFQENCPAKLSEAIRYSLLAPGKRLRPQLVLQANRACGGLLTAAMPAAVAVEMIHAYSLVHDDLPAMDDDDLRRGLPTCHKQYDEATAILVGDALQARAFEIIATEITPADRAAACCAELARSVGAEALVGGQMADLAAETQNVSATELEAIHRRKTGALFCVSLRLGAIVADASLQTIECLNTYGRHLGLAFQIVDDLLDVLGADPKENPDHLPSDQMKVNTKTPLTQNESLVGKRLGKDSQRGKATYPSLLGVEASRHQVQTLVTQACQALKPLGAASEPLAKLAEYVGQRSR